MCVKGKRFLVLTIGLVFMLALATFSAAEDKPLTPTTLQGGKVITADEVKALLDKKGAVFFDTRSPINYGKGHIPTATSLPYKGKSKNAPDFDPLLDEVNMSKLPADKNASIVIYSDGPTGWKSYKLAVTAIKAKYKNIMWYRGGTDEWEGKGYQMER